MVQKSVFVSTGQFAQLTGVSKHTLFFYDDNNLFKPAKVEDNGYRYYSLNQVDTFSVISSLKEIGMPLKQIKQYLDDRSPERFIHLLDTESQKLKEKIARLNQLLDVMEEKKKATATAMSADHSGLTVETLGPRHLYRTAVENVREPRSYYQAFQQHYTHLEQKFRCSSWLESLMVETTNVLDPSPAYPGYIYTEVSRKTDSNLSIPGGDYLTGYFQGDDDKLIEGYQVLIQHARSNELQLGEYIFEELVLDELSFKAYNQYVYKLSVPVVKTSDASSLNPN
ncbi:Transcriptional regulator, MerR family [Alkalibacterium sp. AK22]|uniref:MerR family transcriptional regulator n=1 Tax=Alkalibacterium sp. AK22 TaxID=1229520 RepID=UPI0004497FCA|nr:MerR family transcriptional regulator [Alkalibacterium sp. AK22]EXJ22733.1 Transcriptional regulator, MerR family [Alkalibacterium sp. AK22]